MHSGLLTGKVSKEWFYNLPDNDWRKHKVDHPVVCDLHSDLGLSNFIEFQADLKEILKARRKICSRVSCCMGSEEGRDFVSYHGSKKKGQIKQIVNSIEGHFRKRRWMPLR